MADLTLAVKRGIFRTAFALAATPPGRLLTGALLRSHHPALALQAGEELLHRPRRVLAFTAHPDDLEFFAGGIIRRLALAGCNITAAVLTDGEKRGNKYDLAGVRRREQIEAGYKQGIGRVRFFGLTDFGLPEDPRLEPTVAKVWDEEKPEVVLAFDPKELFPGFANRDHKALGRTVLDLCRHHYGRSRVYYYGTRQPNVQVDIDDVIGDKENAVLTHASQMVYLTEPGHRAAVRWMAAAWASGAPCRFAEGLYRLL
jgi:LmbE family N-acetylglucosaminyl deacetylase